jgi:hypothetical protein
MENKKTLGGKRKGAGRKPVLSKKVQVSLYVEGAKILKFGNEDKMKAHLHDVIDNFGNVEASMALKQYDAPPVFYTHEDEFPKIASEKPQVSSITNLPPKPMASLYDAFMAELNKATMISEVEGIMKRVKGEALLPREKISLENRAKEVSKDMFND